MSLETVGFSASGNIYPCRFVGGVNGTDYKVLQATATIAPIGVSQRGTQEAPGTAADSGYAATDGKQLRVFGAGEAALLEIGSGGCNAFDWLAPDANGKGVAASLNSSSVQYIGAYSLRTASSGDKVPVVVVTRPPTATN